MNQGQSGGSAGGGLDVVLGACGLDVAPRADHLIDRCIARTPETTGPAIGFAPQPVEKALEKRVRGAVRFLIDSRCKLACRASVLDVRLCEVPGARCDVYLRHVRDHLMHGLLERCASRKLMAEGDVEGLVLVQNFLDGDRLGIRRSKPNHDDQGDNERYRQKDDSRGDARVHVRRAQAGE